MSLIKEESCKNVDDILRFPRIARRPNQFAVSVVVGLNPTTFAACQPSDLVSIIRTQSAAYALLHGVFSTLDHTVFLTSAVHATKIKDGNSKIHLKF